ncbi:glycosyltransferase involved in cell wall biosynthesis [Exiguobacterium sp. PvP048]|uniref:glycosyltransferase n=1 Tax=unclassified Exiguobacterium TaxID=2644629 RepID=UPI00339A623D
MESVSVLMSTFNGEKFLKEQIDSVVNQKQIDLKIFVRDDGSTDNTMQILSEYKKKYNNIYIFPGENVGYKKSFMKLIELSNHSSNYYAFCDQDDYWEETKLISAIKLLKKNNYQSKYELYFSSLEIVNSNLEKIGFKSYDENSLTLGSVLSRFNISGCTMVFNQNIVSEIISKGLVKYSLGGHDAWLYKICLCLNAKISLDKNSYIKYRQHGNNVTGINQGFFGRLKKEIKIIKQNKNYNYNTAQILLENFLDIENTSLSKENKAILEKIVNYKKNNFNYLKLIFDNKIKTNSLILNLLTKLKIILKVY